MIFICFSHVERYIVAQSLSYHLKNYGYKIWYDYDELFIGDDGDYIYFFHIQASSNLHYFFVASQYSNFFKTCFLCDYILTFISIKI